MIVPQEKESAEVPHPDPSRWSARVLTNGANQKQASAAKAEPASPTTQQTTKPAHFAKSTSAAHGFMGYVKEKFNKKNLFGTIFLLVLIANNSQYIVAGLKQKRIVETPDGARIESDVDYSRVVQKSTAVLTTVWTLLSSRRSVIPEGDNMMERMWDALKHPDRSQTQARELVLLPLTLYGLGGHLLHGMGTKPATANAFRMSLQRAGNFLYQNSMVERAPNKERQMQAFLGLLSIPLALSSMFGKEAAEKKARQKAEEAQKQTATNNNSQKNNASAVTNAGAQGSQTARFSKSQSKSVDGKSFYLALAAKRIWQDNPKLVISSLLGVLMATLSFAEGLSKRKVMLAKLEEFSGLADFSSKAGELLKKNMQMNPEYALMKDQELMRQVPQYKAEQMKEAHNLMRAGIIGIALSLAGQIYRANEMVQDDILKEQAEAARGR